MTALCMFVHIVMAADTVNFSAWSPLGDLKTISHLSLGVLIFDEEANHRRQ